MGIAFGTRRLRARLVRTTAVVVAVAALGAWSLGVARNDRPAATHDAPAIAPDSTADSTPESLDSRDSLAAPGPATEHPRAVDSTFTDSPEPPVQDVSTPGQASAAPSPAASEPQEDDAVDDTSHSEPTGDPDDETSDAPDDPKAGAIDRAIDPVTGAPRHRVRAQPTQDSSAAASLAQ